MQCVVVGVRLNVDFLKFNDTRSADGNNKIISAEFSAVVAHSKAVDEREGNN